MGSCKTGSQLILAECCVDIRIEAECPRLLFANILLISYCELEANKTLALSRAHRWNGGSLALPTASELQDRKIVVATLSTARTILWAGLPLGHFTHIFIDEAAQVCVVCVCGV